MQTHQKTILTCLLFLVCSNYSYGKEKQREQYSVYNYRLLRDTENLILINPDGTNITLPYQSAAISITESESETRITLTDNTQLLFYGSYLVQHTNTKGITKHLNYSNGELRNNLHCEPLESPLDQYCTSEIQFDFVTPSISSHTTQIDIRPPNCKSYFDDYLSTRRGLQIENALEQHFQIQGYTPTPQTFPVIDFIQSNTAHIIKSKDLSKESFLAKDALYEQLLQDVEEIDKLFQENEKLSAKFDNQSMTINKDQIQHSVLNILVQNGIATEHQKTQILRVLSELKGRSDISLKIIEIP